MNQESKLELQKNEIITLCKNYDFIAGAARPIDVINTLVGVFSEPSENFEFTKEYAMEVMTSTMNLVSFLASMHEGLDEIWKLEHLPQNKTEFNN